MSWKVVKRNAGNKKWAKDPKHSHNNNCVEISKSLRHSRPYVTVKRPHRAAITATSRLKNARGELHMYAKKLPFSYKGIKNVGPESQTCFFSFFLQFRSKTFKGGV